MTPYYEQDGITIYHGDCREILPTFPDKSFDLVLTDPPYGINYDLLQKQHADGGRVSNGGRWKRYFDTGWDREAPDSSTFKLIISKGRSSIFWGGNFFPIPAVGKWLIWNKIQRGYMTDGEMAWSNLSGTSPSIFDLSRADAYINNGETKSHPTQKPLPLISWCIGVAEKTRPVLSILDPFMGSGTTLVAAKQLGRKAVGIEIEEKYCEIAVKRLAQMELF